MSNHVHYLIRPAQPADMPRLMHWLNGYSAMLLNRLLRRRGHFWERRYHAAAVPDRDFGHANPRTAGMLQGYAYAYSNYRSSSRPADDGLSAWHPADQPGLFALDARYHGGPERRDGWRRWRSCGPMCFRRWSGLSASISLLPHCRLLPADSRK
jgi:REP element-mobilizing transposase RayT